MHSDITTDILPAAPPLPEFTPAEQALRTAIHDALRQIRRVQTLDRIRTAAARDMEVEYKLRIIPANFGESYTVLLTSADRVSHGKVYRQKGIPAID